jgi:SAM-dependent methyltransferase
MKQQTAASDRQDSSCPACGHGHIVNRGTIPAADEFAGRMLAAPLPGGSLLACQHCGLQFRHPRPSREKLDELYRAGSSDTWAVAPTVSRVDWQLAAERIRNMAIPRRVMDVGCFDGRFLASLPGGTIRSGLEIHPEAAARAARTGVEIIGNDFLALRSHAAQFDVVTAFDVIEHVYDPAELLNLMIDALRPGGMLIISTGDTQAWSWRLLGSRYWYCKTPEHMSFVSARWFRFALASRPAQVTEVVTFSHGGNSRRRAAMELVKNLAYWSLPSLFSLLRKAGAGQKSIGAHAELADAPPGWITARDHMLVVITRDPA